MTDRLLVVHCPDWPVVASGQPGHEAVAVVFANRVVACSEAARAEGVEVGLRRRQAESRCPRLVVVADDPARDARVFEPVVAAVEAFTPGVEIVRPGTCAFATRGPSRYFGGDRALAELVKAGVDAVLDGVAAGAPGCRVGVADGRLTAALAARSAVPAGVVVPRGGSRAFLAPFPVAAATGGDLELAGLLVRLGIRTLGDLAALPMPAVLARFGAEGAVAGRLARGLDEQPLAARTPPPDLSVTAELDPPADRLETVAFVARSLAEQLHRELAVRGLAATRVLVEAETEHGEWLARRWRHDGGLTPAALAERVRWQVDGWLTGRSRSENGSGPSASPPATVVGATRSPGAPGATKTAAHGVAATVVGATRSPGAPATGVGAARSPGVPGATKTSAKGLAATVVGATRSPDVPATGVGAARSPGVPGAAKTAGRGTAASGAPATTSGDGDRPTGGLVLLRLTPDEVGPDDGRQLGFWGGDRAAAERAARGLARVQGALGPESVVTAARAGGRGPAEQVRLIPWDEARPGVPPPTGGDRVVPGGAHPPWPGRIPPPAPATVHPVPPPAEVVDAAGREVSVTGRATASAPPARMAVAGHPPVDIRAWAGPWPVDERWWDPAAHRRRARAQVVTADGTAHLLAVEGGRWVVEATYD